MPTRRSSVLALLVGILVGTAGGCGEVPGTPPPPVDLGALTDPDPAVRLGACRLLAEAVAPPPAEAVPLLAQGVADENRWVREWAIRALARLGEGAANAVPALVRALHDRDSFVRWRAAQTLATIGTAAREALPVLEEIAASEDETEIGRHWAAQAVRRIR